MNENYRCNICNNNNKYDNYYTDDFHELCREMHCILCVFNGNEICEDFEPIIKNE